MTKKAKITTKTGGGFITVVLEKDCEIHPGCWKKAGVKLEVTQQKAAELKAGGFLDKREILTLKDK